MQLIYIIILKHVPTLYQPAFECCKLTQTSMNVV